MARTGVGQDAGTPDGSNPVVPTAAATALLPTLDEVRRPRTDANAPSDPHARPIDQTQVIPRLPAAATSGWPAALVKPATAAATGAPATPSAPTAGPAAPPRVEPPSSEETAVFARPVLDRVTDIQAAPPDAVAGLGDSQTWIDSADDEYDPDAADKTPTSHQRWMWPSLVVFWLLGLGVGIISLAALGAPHYLCTGAAKGLACHRAGTVMAAVLTVVVIAIVGVASVLAIEARRRGLTWLRYLGIGVVVLAVVGTGGYFLIRTIGG